MSDSDNGAVDEIARVRRQLHKVVADWLEANAAPEVFQTHIATVLRLNMQGWIKGAVQEESGKRYKLMVSKMLRDWLKSKSPQSLSYANEERSAIYRSLDNVFASADLRRAVKDEVIATMARCYRLHRAGYTPKQIGETLGISASRAGALVVSGERREQLLLKELELYRPAARTRSK